MSCSRTGLHLDRSSPRALDICPSSRARDLRVHLFSWRGLLFYLSAAAKMKRPRGEHGANNLIFVRFVNQIAQFFQRELGIIQPNKEKHADGIPAQDHTAIKQRLAVQQLFSPGQRVSGKPENARLIQGDIDFTTLRVCSVWHALVLSPFYEIGQRADMSAA